MMDKIHRNFFERSECEQQWMLENTWWDVCNEADLGMTAPQEYEEDGKIYLEGICLGFKQTVRTEITETTAE